MIDFTRLFEPQKKITKSFVEDVKNILSLNDEIELYEYSFGINTKRDIDRKQGYIYNTNSNKNSMEHISFYLLDKDEVRANRLLFLEQIDSQDLLKYLSKYVKTDKESEGKIPHIDICTKILKDIGKVSKDIASKYSVLTINREAETSKEKEFINILDQKISKTSEQILSGEQPEEIPNAKKIYNDFQETYQDKREIAVKEMLEYHLKLKEIIDVVHDSFIEGAGLSGLQCIYTDILNNHIITKSMVIEDICIYNMKDRCVHNSDIIVAQHFFSYEDIFRYFDYQNMSKDTKEILDNAFRTNISNRFFHVSFRGYKKKTIIIFKDEYGNEVDDVENSIQENKEIILPTIYSFWVFKNEIIHYEEKEDYMNNSNDYSGLKRLIHPYIGYYYENPIMNSLKKHNYLYDFYKNKALQFASKDKGVILEIEQSIFGSSGNKESLDILSEGIVFVKTKESDYDRPNSYPKKGITVHDVSLTSKIVEYDALAQKEKDSIGHNIGYNYRTSEILPKYINKENYSYHNESNINTVSFIMDKHKLFLNAFFNHYIDTCFKYYNKNPNELHSIFAYGESTKEIYNMLQAKTPNYEFSIFVGENENLDKIKSAFSGTEGISMIQNGLIDTRTLTTIIDSKSISEIQRAINKYYTSKKDMAENARQEQMAMEEQKYNLGKQQMELQTEQQIKIDNNKHNNKMKEIAVESITNPNNDGDVNDNGINDSIDEANKILNIQQKKQKIINNQ